MRPPYVRTAQRPERKPFQPAIGRDFDIEPAPTVEARTRGALARGITLFAGAVLILTGTYGLAAGDFMPLMASWAVAGPIVGAIVAYYFGPQGTDTP
jgi:hypothetical protein